jgi:hypothetical protein
LISLKLRQSYSNNLIPSKIHPSPASENFAIKDFVGLKPHFVLRAGDHNKPVMASAYDEIKKALAMIRQGQPIPDQNRAALNRVRTMLEQQLATAEPARNDIPSGILESRDMAVANSLAARKSPEP